MSEERAVDRERAAWNASRWTDRGGHYESWFSRANHPSRPLGFWIRYTLFSPAGGGTAEAELWAIWFDGERRRTVASVETFPGERSAAAGTGLDVHIGDARLDDAGLHGSCDGAGGPFAWDLNRTGGDAPLLLMPAGTYDRGFPQAKVVVPAPRSRYSGTLQVGGDVVPVDGWLGSQNHNWGPRHTDRYAWGQVVEFDDGDGFLECASARLRLGPVWSPWLTLAVLRVGGEELTFNSMVRAPAARVRQDGLSWAFVARNGAARLSVAAEADPALTVGLRYRNPPGGTKVCLNSKVADVSLRLERRDREPVHLTCTGRAAFELLGEESHGVPVLD
jgi:hypothetical protein